MEEKADGSVCVVFKALHNHDCQQEYLLHYLNPLDICPTLSDIVDTKLLAGVTDLTLMHSSMLKVTCNAFMTYSQEITLRKYIRNGLVIHSAHTSHAFTKEVEELREDRNFDSERAYHISLACDPQKIINRKKRLGIKNPFITNSVDVRSVENIVATWAREKGDDSMVLYFKREGVNHVMHSGRV